MAVVVLSRRAVLTGVGGLAAGVVAGTAEAKPRKPGRTHVRAFTDEVGMREYSLVVGPSAGVPTNPSGSTTVFQDSFASGAFTAWDSCQWNAGGSIRNDDCQSYNGTSDYSATVANGGTGHTQSARFEIRNGDIPFGGTERTEIARAPGSDVVLNDERWIDWWMKFDSSWPVPISGSGWCVIWQWHDSSDTGSPPLCLDIDPDDIIRLCNNDASGFQRTVVQPVQRNVWQNWMVHAKFSTTNTVGFGEVWIDGVQVLAQHARQTMRAGSTGNYFKTGIYRDPANTATGILWHDDIVMTAP